MIHGFEAEFFGFVHEGRHHVEISGYAAVAADTKARADAEFVAGGEIDHANLEHARVGLCEQRAGIANGAVNSGRHQQQQRRE